jgi:hypothetical protein
MDENYAEILKRLAAIEDHVKHIRYGDGNAYIVATMQEQARYQQQQGQPITQNPNGFGQGRTIDQYGRLAPDEDPKHG